jgi:hypothetical protein
MEDATAAAVARCTLLVTTLEGVVKLNFRPVIAFKLG